MKVLRNLFHVIQFYVFLILWFILINVIMKEASISFLHSEQIQIIL